MGFTGTSPRVRPYASWSGRWGVGTGPVQSSDPTVRDNDRLSATDDFYILGQRLRQTPAKLLGRASVLERDGSIVFDSAFVDTHRDRSLGSGHRPRTHAEDPSVRIVRTGQKRVEVRSLEIRGLFLYYLSWNLRNCRIPYISARQVKPGSVRGSNR